ncbi:Fe-S cluster assembly protein SufD [Pseudanabaena sp. FACHB-2040]|uniref:Fe-S cluster assembly protein SufD n=1 Tax=Pseudanabaena sp. FACHB-2040 TaxID=2692859 RepID=UPI001689B2E7|nr:Fe-S cluster assembly protein SufD [Pseudanabaena sp. FACHB-2040]MBD2257445.1 Fe-S cluster assembly protein SufD [Pseudanabaena sp. FACHB-2040]
MSIQISETQPGLTAAEKRETYLKALLATVQGSVPATLALPTLRGAAEALVKERSFPSSRDEEWRFTDLSALLEISFEATSQAATVGPESLAAVVLSESQQARLVFVNGQYNADLSSTAGLPEGVVVGNLAALYAQTDWQQKIDSRLGQQSGGHEIFTALNTAGFQDSAVIWVPRNQVVDTPIQIIFVSVPQPESVVAQPRCLVVAEAGSALALVEEFWGAASGSHLTNAVSEIWVDDNAQVTHVRVQREGTDTFHIGKTAVTQGRDSRYAGTAISLGAQLSRHHWEMYQAGEQTDTKLYGLNAIANTQTADTHSLIALAQPYGTVDQLHKSIVDDRAHSIFSGMIAVPQAAQMTNANQLNRNLLLSDKGRVDTKPQLDIVADNVKCSHGATISQLEADEIFYLQSRGINAAQAQQLLIYAFAMEVIDTIPVESLKAALTRQVAERTPE